MNQKTDLSELKRIPREDDFDWSDQYRGPPGGVWIVPRKKRRIRAFLVNERKERLLRCRWILTWVVAIPLAVYSSWWLLVFVKELFLFTA
ncbi:MAG: hypothetical protein HKO64_10425 [Xanthomonadales bacterium]|nr:hypothetical protein [Xanthomonadales bacterium]NNL96023.1 hypothetical protein [Xanthomonadales bacterium]